MNAASAYRSLEDARTDLEQAEYVLLRAAGWRTVYGWGLSPTLRELAVLLGVPWRRILELHDVAAEHGLVDPDDVTWLPTIKGRRSILEQCRPLAVPVVPWT